MKSPNGRHRIVTVRLTEDEYRRMEVATETTGKNRSDLFRQTWLAEEAMLRGDIRMKEMFKDLNPEALVSESIISVADVIRLLK